MEKSDYHKYLASREWALLKAKVKKRSGGICERCRVGKHSATHHLTYERIGRERLTDIIGVCEECHKFLSGASNFDPEKWVVECLGKAISSLGFARIILNYGAFESRMLNAINSIEQIIDYLYSEFETPLITDIETRMSMMEYKDGENKNDQA